jgi:hypothetical protein
MENSKSSGPLIKPENYAKIAIYAGIAIAIKIFAWDWIMNFVTEAVHLAFMLGFLGFIIFLFTSTRVGVYWNVICKYIASFFVAVFPLEIMQEYIDSAKDKRALIDKELGKVKGAKVQIEEEISTNKHEAEKAIRLGQAARNQGDEQEAGFQAGTAKQYLLANEDLLPTLNTLTIMYNRMDKMYVNSEYVVRGMENQLAINTRKFKALQAGSNIIDSANAIYSKDSKERQIFDEAFNFLKEDMANRAGVIDRFLDSTTNIAKQIDLEKGANVIDGLNLLDQFEKDGDIDLLLNPKNNEGPITLNLPDANKVTAPKNNKFDSYLKR